MATPNPNIPPGARLAGKVGGNEQALAMQWSMANGSSYTRTIRGLHADMWAAIGSEIGNAVSFTLTPEPNSALSTLQITYICPPGGSPTVLSQNLDLKWNEQTLSIFKNATYAAISDERAGMITGLVRDVLFQKAGESDTAWVARISAEIASKQLSAAEQSALSLLLRESTGFIFLQPTFIFTRTVCANYSRDLTVANAGKIWSSAQVGSYLDSAAVLVDIAQALGNIGAPDGTFLGWFYKPELTLTAMGTIQLIESFTYGAWETALYNPL